ncbi:hypothetical protein AMTRI_Chr06g176000 [Amborella trichopoda]
MDHAKALTLDPPISPPSSDQTLTLDQPISPRKKLSLEQTLTLDPPISTQKAPSSEQTITLHPLVSPQNTPYSEKALILGHDHQLQNIIVMHHGDRLDVLKRSWKQTAQKYNSILEVSIIPICRKQMKNETLPDNHDCCNLKQCN